MPSLSDKLKSLGVSVGFKPTGETVVSPHQQEIGQQVSAVSAAHPKLDDVLGGHTLKNSQGETYIVESHYPLDYQQGRVGLFAASSLRMLANWAGNPDLGDLKPELFAFLDTETTGLSGGTGTYAFLIGAARFEESEFHLTQFFMRDPADEPAELVALEEFLAPCQAIVTFNGKTFDAPLLNTRYMLQGWRSPLFDLGHFDLLHLARRLWRDRLPSRTLMNLEVQILGTERTEEDIPGWAIPQMYFDYIRSGDPTPLKNVLYHNAMDVVSLAALFNHMAGLLAHPFEASIEHGVDLIALARLYEDLGETQTAIGLYLQGLEFEDRSTDRHIDETPEEFVYLCAKPVRILSPSTKSPAIAEGNFPGCSRPARFDPQTQSRLPHRCHLVGESRQPSAYSRPHRAIEILRTPRTQLSGSVILGPVCPGDHPFYPSCSR